MSYNSEFSEENALTFLENNKVRLCLSLATEDRLAECLRNELEKIASNGAILTEVYLACDEWFWWEWNENVPDEQDLRKILIKPFLEQYVFPLVINYPADVRTPNSQGKFNLMWILEFDDITAGYCDRTHIDDWCDQQAALEVPWDDSELYELLEQEMEDTMKRCNA